ncbi:terminase small subunit [Lactiplantibacillus pentosus]|uniref:terminase small subunit n=1 Tax=Lactiplantibacillus pentosus TaxID=1589 RepID=UPI001CD73BB8|nr:terminase small subunit [Lactiplantibacillus pentosus]MCJ8183079.1 terminase small subunit [Lactiplantibacillus pentosus]
MKRKLTPKQRKFANEFIKTNNAYQSAINAGYSKNYASVGTKKLLENVRIQNYIQQKTGDVEKRESVEADEVLKNIYRISAGKEIERHYVKIDNLAKEAVGGDDSIEARMEYMTDETIITPASTKEQVAAAELWFKLSGRLKNDSKDVEDQKVRKLKADADIAEAKASIMNASTDSTEAKVSEYLDKLDDVLGGDSDGN